ncbi:MAG TPA: hypothetical protein PLD79_09840 [Halothiobacillus sp.]|nr:hypothetical protein [Halothiobacillus sp.]
MPVIRPTVRETTALGAAYAAGLAVGFWNSTDELSQNWQPDKVFTPTMDEPTRSKLYASWHKAVLRSFDWIEDQ